MTVLLPNRAALEKLLNELLTGPSSAERDRALDKVRAALKKIDSP